MAASNYANYQIFNDRSRRTAMEGIAQVFDLFNTNSRGGISLTSAAKLGSYDQIAFKKRISGLVERRDPKVQDAISTATQTEGLESSVKVFGRTKVVNLDPSILDWQEGRARQEGIAFGQQLTEDMLADMLNSGLAAVTAALITETSNLYDGTAGTLSLSALNSGVGKMGDRSQQVIAWVMHSKCRQDLYGAALTNANVLFDFGTVQIVHDGFGRPIIVTDSPALTYSDSGTKYRTVGLVSGGIQIEQNDDFREMTAPVVGYSNLQLNYQAQWSFNLRIKGFTWDVGNGGQGPSDANLATGALWDKVATSNKDLAGVVVLSQ